MVKLSKRTLSVLLTLLMVISMISFSGLTVSAATTQTTAETPAGTATYIVRMGAMSNVSVVGGAMGTLTYPTAKLTLVSATVSADFATKSENTAPAGTIKWNGIGDVSYASNKAILTVNFTIKEGQTVTAADFVSSGWQVVTKASASADPVIATDGTGLIEEIGLPKAETPQPPILALKDDVASSYQKQEETVEGEKITVLMGVMPKTTVANFKNLFKPVDGYTVKVFQNAKDTEYTTGNTRTGARVVLVNNSNNNIADTWFVAVRGDMTASGTCIAPDKVQLTKALAAGPAVYFGRTESTLGACKFLAAGSLNGYKDAKVNAVDKIFIVAYIAKGVFAR